MKKTIIIAALSLAAAFPTSAKIAFQTERSIRFVQPMITTDNSSKLFTIDDDNNVEIYDTSLNRIKSFKCNIQDEGNSVEHNIYESCSNADNIKISDCYLREDGEYKYYNDNSEWVALTATSVDDMVSKLSQIENKTFYKITMNDKAGAYNKDNFYSLNNNGTVIKSRYFPDYDDIITFENENALTWEFISEDYYSYTLTGLVKSVFSDYDNPSGTYGTSAILSQNIFNNDSKWEYITTKYDNKETFSKCSYKVNSFSDDGRMIIKRSSYYHRALLGYSIMNEDGAEAGFIAKPAEAEIFYIDEICTFGNKYYVLADVDTYDGHHFSYLIDIDNLSSVALSVERKDNMRVVSQGDVVEIILPKNASNGEVGIVSMNGQTLGCQKVGDGQTCAKFNSANLAKGIYNATFIHKDGKRESQKFIVK
ncbi:MAG: hypothetical protein ACI4A8_02925 [Muribaculaceae bacterium]